MLNLHYQFFVCRIIVLVKIIESILKVIFALIFISAGILHFVKSDLFVKIMPPVFPFPLFWVYLSGVFEFVLGVMLLIPRYTRIAAWGLIGLLIAVFPANVYMAMNPQIFSEFSPAVLYARLPLQIVLIAWASWFTKPNDKG